MGIKYNICPVCKEKMGIDIVTNKDHCLKCKRYFKR